MNDHSTESDAINSPDPPIGPKGPTKAAINDAIDNINKARKWLAEALNEIDRIDLDEAQNWLSESLLFVQQAERSISYAREIREGK